MAQSKIVHVKNGKAYRIYFRRSGVAVLYTTCCDCSLTHLEEIKPTRRYVRIKVWREEPITKARRKARRKAHKPMAMITRKRNKRYHGDH